MTDSDEYSTDSDEYSTVAESFRNSTSTFRCRDQKWKTYRFVVGDGEDFEVFLDPDPQTFQKNSFDLHDDDPETVYRMLTWSNTSDYNDEPGIQSVANMGNILQSLAIPGIRAEDSPAAISSGANLGVMQSRLARAMVNIDVCSISESYILPDLQEKAIEKCLDQQWSTWTHAELALLAKKMHNCSAPGPCKALLKNAISDYVDRLLDEGIPTDQTCAVENPGDFACELCHQLRIRASDRKIALLQDQLVRSEQCQLGLEEELRDMQCERDDAVRLCDVAVNGRVEHDSCRQCGNRFGAYIQSQQSPSFQLYLACKNCHTLH
ncbi:hypothetical protein MMC07_003008 [Pseudocyphellaria aurata]|nr:hypothetical protein [Pseudocyphellaria aurata]